MTKYISEVKAICTVFYLYKVFLCSYWISFLKNEFDNLSFVFSEQEIPMRDFNLIYILLSMSDVNFVYSQC